MIDEERIKMGIIEEAVGAARNIKDAVVELNKHLSRRGDGVLKVDLEIVGGLVKLETMIEVK